MEQDAGAAEAEAAPEACPTLSSASDARRIAITGRMAWQ